MDGLPTHYYAQPVNPLPLSERIENADRFMTNTSATIHHGGNRAFYSPARDVIQLPPFEAFKDKESYYATALHCHSARPFRACQRRLKIPHLAGRKFPTPKASGQRRKPCFHSAPFPSS